MQILDILIVEDDPSYAMDLEILLEEELPYSNKTICNNAETAIERVKHKSFDLIILDIGLEGNMTGLDFAASIVELEIPILFLTSYMDDHSYQEAQKFNMIGYLVKPLENITLRSMIDLVVKQLTQKQLINETTLNNKNNEPIKIIVKKNNNYSKIDIDEIIFIQSDAEYIMIHTNQNKFALRQSLKQIENKLNNRFFRIHKSYLINISHIEVFSYAEGEIILSNGQKLPVARRKKKDLLAKWQSLDTITKQPAK